MLLEALLDVADSSLTYRRRYLTHLETPAVVDLLLADEMNPRAAAFGVAALEEHLAQLPHEAPHPQLNSDRQLVLKLRSRLRLMDLADVCKPEGGRRRKLGQVLSDMSDQLSAVSDAISRIYFSHSTMPRHLFQSELEAN